MKIENIPHERIWNLYGGQLKQISKPLLVDSNKFNAVFDFDGVITAPQRAKSLILSSMGYNISPEMTNKKFALKAMQKESKKSVQEVKKDYMTMIQKLYVDNILDIMPEKNAIDVLHRLQNHPEINTFILTSRESSKLRPEIQATGPWLTKYDLNFNAIINTCEQPKKNDLIELNADFYVDDSLGKIVDLYETNHDLDDGCSHMVSELDDACIAFFRQASNQHVKVPNYIYDIKDGWLGMEKLIYSLLK